MKTSQFQNISVEVNIELDIQKALTVHITAMTVETAGTKEQTTKFHLLPATSITKTDIHPLKKTSHPHPKRQSHFGIISKHI